ncbi:hypothetical protein [Streptomyces rubellomurinus]|uniref:Uncharacterized protein n=1 Tax=Streptomyces rubellomurinus (strain ATCC 31215) TaxID=359131 RepID=A0A0F2T9P3_STRR3|nr:hypothetical protein [Streptomyces rubellomurinus]KJS58467.1 hypothetical protein VM95_33180 [Streptomyces rubellomurinus]
MTEELTLHIDTMTPQRFAELLSDSTVPAAHRALWALLAEVEFNLTDFLSLDVRDTTATMLSAAGASKTGLTEMLIPENASVLLQETIGDRTEGAVFMEDGKSMSREAAVQAARQYAGCSIHAFRNSGFEWKSRPAD